MIVVEYISDTGRQIEEAADTRAAERREKELRARGTRYVVWFVIDEGAA